MPVEAGRCVRFHDSVVDRAMGDPVARPARIGWQGYPEDLKKEAHSYLLHAIERARCMRCSVLAECLPDFEVYLRRASGLCQLSKEDRFRAL